MTSWPGLVSAALSDRGHKREHNEDFEQSVLPPQDSPDAAYGALFVVADGVGGIGLGDVASRAAVESLVAAYYDPEAPTADPLSRLQRAIKIANDAVQARAVELEVARIGTTLAGVIVTEQQALVFNVGDSRVYRVRRGLQEQLSRDQVSGGGGLQNDEVAGRRGSKLSAYVGQSTALEPVISRAEIQPGDVFVLCSDGLWDLVQPAEMISAVRSKPETAARRMVNLVLSRGAPDNVTVSIIRFAGGRGRLMRWVAALVLLLALIGAIAAGVILLGADADDGDSGAAIAETTDEASPVPATPAAVLAVATNTPAPSATIDRTSTAISAATQASVQTSTEAAAMTQVSEQTAAAVASEQAAQTDVARFTADALASQTAVVVATESQNQTRIAQNQIAARTNSALTVTARSESTSTSAAITAAYNAGQGTAQAQQTAGARATAAAESAAGTGTAAAIVATSDAEATATNAAATALQQTAVAEATAAFIATRDSVPTATLDLAVISPTPSSTPTATATPTATFTPSPTPTFLPTQVLVEALTAGVALAQNTTLFTVDLLPDFVVQLVTVPLPAGTPIMVLPGRLEGMGEGEPALVRIRVLDETARTGWIAEDALGGAQSLTATVTVTSSGGAVLRTGNGVAFDPAWSMQQGETAEIIAIASSGPRWFYVRTDVGREGWVSPDVVTVQGNVSNLPLRIPPPPPTAAPQGEATADPSAPAPDTATEEATAEAAP